VLNKAKIIFLYFLLYNLLTSQIISGTVFDATSGKKLIGANVFILNTTCGTNSDKNGNFSFDLSIIKNGKHILRVSYLGYVTQDIPIKIPSKKIKNLQIKLKESPFQLDQVVVTGTRSERFLKDTPVSTRIIKKRELEESGCADISDALSEITGLNLNENQFGSGVNTIEIQGLSSQHIQILVNGTKMIGRINGQLDISQIPISQIERIEIVKGASSALYGSEAMGGVINIITKKTSNHLSMNNSINFGSYGRVDGSFAINLPVLNWKPSLNLNYRKYDGYDLDLATPSEDATAFEKYHGQFSLLGEISKKFLLKMETIVFKEKQEAVSSSFFKDKILNSKNAIRIESEVKEIFPNFQLKSGLEYSDYSHQFDRIVLRSGFVKKGSLTTESLAKADIFYDFKLGKFFFNGGIAFESEEIESDRILGRKRSTNLVNAFFQNEYLQK
jgi:hypothetical protein